MNIRPGYGVEDTKKLFELCSELWFKPSSAAPFEQLIREGRPDPLAVDSQGDMPLHKLIRQGIGYVNPDIRFDWLLAQPGIDLNALDGKNNTPLLLLIADPSRFRYLKPLLASPQVDPDATDNSGKALVHHIANWQPTQLVRLMAAGANFDRTIVEKDTPLDVPAYYAEVDDVNGDYVQACLNHADAIWEHLRKSSIFSSRTLQAAWKHGSTAVKEQLEECKELNARCRARDATVHSNITNAQSAVTRLLNGGYIHQLFDPLRWKDNEQEALDLISSTLRDPQQRSLAPEILMLKAQQGHAVIDKKTPLRTWREQLGMQKELFLRK